MLVAHAALLEASKLILLLSPLILLLLGWAAVRRAAVVSGVREQFSPVVAAATWSTGSTDAERTPGRTSHFPASGQKQGKL